MKSQSQQPLFIPRVIHFAADIEDGGRLQSFRFQILNSNDGLLLNDKKTPGAVSGICNGHRVGQCASQLKLAQMIHI